MEQTFLMINPDGVQRGLVGKINSRLKKKALRGGGEWRRAAARSSELLTLFFQKPAPFVVILPSRLEVDANIAKRPPEIPMEQWIAFLAYRARPDTKAKAEKNAINRTHLTVPHTLGSKSIARLTNEMENQLRRSVTRAELFQASHTTSDGSFVNEEAMRSHEELLLRSQTSSEDDAFIGVFGKDHPGYARGLGLGVVLTQIYGSSSRSRNVGDATGSQQAEIDSLKESVQRLTQMFQESEQRLQSQISHLNNKVGGENENLPANEENVGSPVVGRPSSQGSHSATAQHNCD